MFIFISVRAYKYTYVRPRVCNCVSACVSTCVSACVCNCARTWMGERLCVKLHACALVRACRCLANWSGHWIPDLRKRPEAFAKKFTDVSFWEVFFFVVFFSVCLLYWLFDTLQETRPTFLRNDAIAIRSKEILLAIWNISFEIRLSGCFLNLSFQFL